MKYSSVEITADPHGRDPVFYMPADDGIHISSDISELVRLFGASSVISRDALKMFRGRPGRAVRRIRCLPHRETMFFTLKTLQYTFMYQYM